MEREEKTNRPVQLFIAADDYPFIPELCTKLEQGKTHYAKYIHICLHSKMKYGACCKVQG